MLFWEGWLGQFLRMILVILSEGCQAHVSWVSPQTLLQLLEFWVACLKRSNDEEFSSHFSREREREREYCFPCCLNNKFGFMNGSPKKVATFSSWVSAHAIHAWDRPTRRNRAAKTCSTQKRAATLDQPSLINLTVPDVCLGRFCMCSYLSRWYCIYDIDFVRYVLKNGEKEVCESFAPDF